MTEKQGKENKVAGKKKAKESKKGKEKENSKSISNEEEEDDSQINGYIGGTKYSIINVI